MMNFDLISKILFCVFSYFICGIPFGYLIYRLVKHDDIRKYGSGNIGATNVGRLLGKKYAVITFLLDGLKGFLCILFAKLIFSDLQIDNTYFYILMIICVLGHIYSPYLKFKGGKAVAITVMMLFILNIKLGLCMSLCWLLCFKKTKISALSALSAIFCTCIFSFFVLDLNNALIILLLTIIIFYVHRTNIERLIKGEELGFKK